MSVAPGRGSAGAGGSPERRAELEELARRLDEHAAEERAILAAARAETGAPGEDKVAETLRRLAAERRPARSARASRRWFPLAAAAAIVGVLLAARVLFLAPEGAVDPGPGARTLGTGGLELVAPAEPVAGPWSTIAWDYPAPSGVTFTLRVLDPARDWTVLAEERGLREPRFTFAPELTARWPDRIWIEIDVVDAAGELLDSLSAERSRSSR